MLVREGGKRVVGRPHRSDQRFYGHLPTTLMDLITSSAASLMSPILDLLQSPSNKRPMIADLQKQVGRNESLICGETALHGQHSRDSTVRKNAISRAVDQLIPSDAVFEFVLLGNSKRFGMGPNSPLVKFRGQISSLSQPCPYR